MSQTKPQAGGSKVPRGCTPAVIVFAALAIIFVTLASATLGYFFTRPGAKTLEEAGTKFTEWIGGDSAEDDVASDEDTTIADAQSEVDSAIMDAEIEAALDADVQDEVTQEEQAPSNAVSEFVESQVDQDPVPFPDEVAGQAQEPAPAPEPEAESTSTVPEIAEYETPALGLVMDVYDHYSYGSMVNMPDPYSFVKPGSCNMRMDVFPTPTADLPGATPLEAVNGVYQAKIDTSSSSYTWNPLGPAYELEVKGQPAARLEVERIATDDKRMFFQYTVIRGDAISAVVFGRVGNKCFSRIGAENLPALSNLTDSVRLTPQLPVCYVGKEPLEEDYSVACDQWGGTGASILMQGDHSEVVLGPTTWDECARFMREHDQVGWEES